VRQYELTDCSRTPFSPYLHERCHSLGARSGSALPCDGFFNPVGSSGGTWLRAGGQESLGKFFYASWDSSPNRALPSPSGFSYSPQSTEDMSDPSGPSRPAVFLAALGIALTAFISAGIALVLSSNWGPSAAFLSNSENSAWPVIISAAVLEVVQGSLVIAYALSRRGLGAFRIVPSTQRTGEVNLPSVDSTTSEPPEPGSFDFSDSPTQGGPQRPEQTPSGRRGIVAQVLKWLPLGLLLQLLVVVGLLVAGRVFSGFDPTKISGQLEKSFATMTAGEKWALVVVAGIFAPVAEEVYFRGMLLYALESPRIRGGRQLAIQLSAAAFAAAHLNYFAFPIFFALGVLLAWLVGRKQSIWPAVGVHMGFNLTALAVALLSSSL
jgi:membrane protease YdiL (CAAX protease family)